jgi:hypothetical protein
MGIAALNLHMDMYDIMCMDIGYGNMDGRFCLGNTTIMHLT